MRTYIFLTLLLGQGVIFCQQITKMNEGGGKSLKLALSLREQVENTVCPFQQQYRILGTFLC